MQTIETIPLFRTATTAPSAALPVAESAPTAAALPTMAKPAIAFGDLTGYIGLNVDGSTWAAVQAECAHRYGGNWTMYADQTGDNYHITRLHARPATYAAHDQPDSHAAREWAGG